jgi:hypothetical protein
MTARPVLAGHLLHVKALAPDGVDHIGGLKARIPLLDSIASFQFPTSPKLIPAPET